MMGYILRWLAGVLAEANYDLDDGTFRRLRVIQGLGWLLLGLVIMGFMLGACSGFMDGPTPELQAGAVRRVGALQGEIVVEAYLAATRQPTEYASCYEVLPMDLWGEGCLPPAAATLIAKVPTNTPQAPCPDGYHPLYVQVDGTPEPLMCERDQNGIPDCARLNGTPAAALDPVCVPGPLSTLSPAERIYGQPLVDLYRMEDVWACGSTANDCMLKEPDELVLARVALGEAPQSADDQVFIMWLIRLRAELGFKHAGVAGDGTGWCGNGWCDQPDRWGSRTTIKQEALCVGGCQFEPVMAAQTIWFPCLLNRGHALRKMLCPTADQLADFDLTVKVARAILAAPMSDFPEELRGYDNIRSPEIVGEGQCNRDPCGERSRWFFSPGGNIWRDEFADDNAYWAELEAAGNLSGQ